MAQKRSDLLVEDATKPLRLAIREEHRDAYQCSPGHCVVANAAMALVKGAEDVKIGAGSARILIKGKWKRYNLSTDTKAMIRAYDKDNQTMPAGVVVELVPPKVAMGSRKGEKQGTKGKGLNSPRHVASRAPSTRNIFTEPPEARARFTQTSARQAPAESQAG